MNGRFVYLYLYLITESDRGFPNILKWMIHGSASYVYIMTGDGYLIFLTMMKAMVITSMVMCHNRKYTAASGADTKLIQTKNEVALLDVPIFGTSSVSFTPSKSASFEPSNSGSDASINKQTMIPSSIPSVFFLSSKIADIPSLIPQTLLENEISESKRIGEIIGQTREHQSNFTVAEGIAMFLAFTMVVSVTSMYVSLYKQSKNRSHLSSEYSVSSNSDDISISLDSSLESDIVNENAQNHQGSIASQVSGLILLSNPSFRSQNHLWKRNNSEYDGVERGSKQLRKDSRLSYPDEEGSCTAFSHSRYQINWQGEVIPDQNTIQYSESLSSSDESMGVVDSVICCSR